MRNILTRQLQQTSYYLRRTSHATPSKAQTCQFPTILAVVQQTLIPSRVNYEWGFELPQSVVGHIPSATLKPLMKSVVVMLLTRLHTAAYLHMS